MHDMRAASQKNRKIKNSCQCASSRKKRRGKKREQVFRIMSPRVMTRENRSKKFFLRVAASREERETRDVAFDYFFRVFVTPKKDKDFGSRFRATSASARGTRVTVRAKCRFARSFVAMSRSPLASAAGLACVFVLMFAPRADRCGTRTRANYCLTNTAPVRAASARATASRAGAGRWTQRSTPNTKMATNRCVRPERTTHPSPPRAIAKRRLAPRATTPTSLPRNRARPPPVAHPSPPSRTQTYAPVRCMQFTCEPYSWRISDDPPEGAVADAVGKGVCECSRIKQLEKPKEEDLEYKWCSRVASCATATGCSATGTPAWLPTTRTTARSSKPTPISSGTSPWTSASRRGSSSATCRRFPGRRRLGPRHPEMAPKMNCQCARFPKPGCVQSPRRRPRRPRRSRLPPRPEAPITHQPPTALGSAAAVDIRWPPPQPAPPTFLPAPIEVPLLVLIDPAMLDEPGDPPGAASRCATRRPSRRTPRRRS